MEAIAIFGNHTRVNDPERRASRSEARLGHRFRGYANVSSGLPQIRWGRVDRMLRPVHRWIWAIPSGACQAARLRRS